MSKTLRNRSNRTRNHSKRGGKHSFEYVSLYNPLGSRARHYKLQSQKSKRESKENPPSFFQTLRQKLNFRKKN